MSKLSGSVHAGEPDRIVWIRACKNEPMLNYTEGSLPNEDKMTYRTEQYRSLLDLRIYVAHRRKTKHIFESMIHMECTESEKHFQVGQKYSSI